MFSLGSGTWCSLTGQNFTQNMAPATIDFAGVHIWPDLWTVSLTLLPVRFQLWLHLQWGVLACNYFESTVGIVVSQHS